MIDRDLLNLLSKKRQIEKILEQTPQPVRPTVTQADADNGFITRYFIRQTTDKTFIVEVDVKQYDSLKDNPRFVTTKIKWKIIGKLETTKLPNGINLFGVRDQNRITVADADLTFGGLRDYISNYGELWLRDN
jgi:hypothetical protein